jgi:hypothetical protein
MTTDGFEAWAEVSKGQQLADLGGIPILVSPSCARSDIFNGPGLLGESG